MNDTATRRFIKHADVQTDVVIESMLTTLDNPYNPFTQFDQWYSFDVERGYNSCGLLARIAKSSDELSEIDESLAIEEAINTIIELNIPGLYVKVTRDSFKDRSGN